MHSELEAAVLDGDRDQRAGPGTGRHGPPGPPCANCGAILQGAWCHDCGQLAEDFHRSDRPPDHGGCRGTDASRRPVLGHDAGADPAPGETDARLHRRPSGGADPAPAAVPGRAAAGVLHRLGQWRAEQRLPLRRQGGRVVTGPSRGQHRQGQRQHRRNEDRRLERLAAPAPQGRAGGSRALQAGPGEPGGAVRLHEPAAGDGDPVIAVRVQAAVLHLRSHHLRPALALVSGAAAERDLAAGSAVESAVRPVPDRRADSSVRPHAGVLWGRRLRRLFCGCCYWRSGPPWGLSS